MAKAGRTGQFQREKKHAHTAHDRRLMTCGPLVLWQFVSLRKTVGRGVLSAARRNALECGLQWHDGAPRHTGWVEHQTSYYGDRSRGLENLEIIGDWAKKHRI